MTLCSLCHGSGSDPKSLPDIPVKPLCPHCLGSGDEPEIKNEEDLDNDDSWEIENALQEELEDIEDILTDEEDDQGPD